MLARSVLVRFPDPLGKWPQPRQGTWVGRRRSRSGGLSPIFLSSQCAGVQQSWRSASRPRMPGLGSRLPQWNVHVQAYHPHMPISKIYTTPLVTTDHLIARGGPISMHLQCISLCIFLQNCSIPLILLFHDKICSCIQWKSTAPLHIWIIFQEVWLVTRASANQNKFGIWVGIIQCTYHSFVRLVHLSQFCHSH